MTENKRFTITGDRSISDHQKKRLYDLNDFDGMISVTECLNELNNENLQLKDENKKLKEKIKLIFGQIKAFRDDCVIYTDFAGASTLNRLLDILDVSMEIWE